MTCNDQITEIVLISMLLYNKVSMNTILNKNSNDELKRVHAGDHWWHRGASDRTRRQAQNCRCTVKWSGCNRERPDAVRLVVGLLGNPPTVSAVLAGGHQRGEFDQTSGRSLQIAAGNISTEPPNADWPWRVSSTPSNGNERNPRVHLNSQRRQRTNRAHRGRSRVRAPLPSGNL